MRQLLGRLLVGLGYMVVGIGAVLTPVAYAFDQLDTLPAIAVALAVIAVGVCIVLLGDKIASGRGDYPLTDPLDGRSNPARTAD